MGLDCGAYNLLLKNRQPTSATDHRTEHHTIHFKEVKSDTRRGALDQFVMVESEEWGPLLTSNLMKFMREFWNDEMRR